MRSYTDGLVRIKVKDGKYKNFGQISPVYSAEPRQLFSPLTDGGLIPPGALEVELLRFMKMNNIMGYWNRDRNKVFAKWAKWVARDAFSTLNVENEN